MANRTVHSAVKVTHHDLSQGRRPLDFRSFRCPVDNFAAQPTWATTNTRRNGKNVRPSGRAGYASASIGISC